MKDLLPYELGVLVSDDIWKTPTERGHYDLAVTVPQDEFHAAIDKRSFVLRAIAQHLAKAVHSTQIPTYLWKFLPEKGVRQHLNLPDPMTFEHKGPIQ